MGSCASSTPRSVACLGGGHGLFQTLTAAKLLEPDAITAVVTVADDGGSSGRIRREMDTIPPGDLRMALAALSPDTPQGNLWEETLQHRFGGHGALAGHALGNLLLVGLSDVLGSHVQALDMLASMLRSRGRVLPVCPIPLDIEADVAGLEDDPRMMRAVRGQVAVATTPGEVRRVRVVPEQPAATPEALSAIMEADLVTLGPGSWFSSIIPHLLVPEIVEALNDTSAHRVVVLNLTSEPGETQGFSTERHIHMLRQHAPMLRLDTVLVDSSTLLSRSEREHVVRAAESIGARVEYADLTLVEDGQQGRDSVAWKSPRHDPHKLAAALAALSA